MNQRRPHSTQGSPQEDSSHRPKQPNKQANSDTHEHEHRQEEASHSHSHSLFGHSHSNGDEGHSHGTELIAALEKRGDRGSRVTLIGLVANVFLTSAKGLAGWYLHSASLLADAGHSLSDLLGDFVTLFCWRLSRKPPSERYPYGFAKIETVGTTIISILLIGGALGIGVHSYHLLIAALSASAESLPPGPAHELLLNVTSIAPDFHFGHGHGHVHSVDPNAAWFAGISVLAKEWLYRITKVVADEEKSPVLLANAIHHRSDAYSSLVAFFAILGSWFFPAIPLDPIGGLLVSIVIFRQGLDLFYGACADLTDAGVSSKKRQSMERILSTLISDPDRSIDSARIIAFENLRARRAGSMLFVDLTAVVPESMTIHETSILEQKITRTLKEAKREIAEVRVKFEPSHKDSSLP